MMKTETPSAPDVLNSRDLLKVLTALRRGDFSVRMPAGQTGTAGKIACALNDVIELNERMCAEFRRIGDAVGKEGRITQRATIGGMGGGWRDCVDSVNGLIRNMAQPYAEIERVIGGVAKGDLGQTMPLNVEGRPLKGEFLRTACAINAMLEQLNSPAGEVSRAGREAGAEGEPGSQADIRPTRKDPNSKVPAFADLTRQRDELERRNRQLQDSIAELEQAQESIRKLNSELERRVAGQTEELQWSNSELRQFAYIASHDLQEPLRTVASYTQLLARHLKGHMDQDAEQFVEYVTSAIRRMHSLLEDMLAYSRASDLKPVTNRTVDCEGVLNWVLMNLSASVQDSGALITHDPLPKLALDESHLIQVLQNLIANAIKYRGETPPRIHIGARQAGDFWELSVRDDGIGIAPEYHDTIFGLFKRLHGKEVPGTGIGLAICKKIVQKYGGRIWVDSAPGEGSTFHFTLPE